MVAATPIAAIVWCAAVLIALPAWFPGERAEATERGLRTLAAPTGDTSARALAGLARNFVDLFGEHGGGATRARPPAKTSPGGSPPGPADAAQSSAPAPARAARVEPAERRPAAPRRPTTTILPYEGDSTSLRVRVDFDGPVIGEQFEMILDTGATLTTLDHASLSRLGVEVGADAPWIRLRTANGMIDAPLVLLDAVWLGGEPVEWVTVAVCDSCANPPIAGLLGLNVTGRFRVSLDHDRQRVELAPRRRAGGSALDVGQWLEVRSRAVRRPTGAVDLALTAANRSARDIEEAVVNLSCGEQTFAIQVDDIPARDERTTEISLPRGTDCSEQSVTVSRGRFLLDRF